MATLYPPVIEGALPAFSSSSGLYIPYELNRAVGYGEIKGFSVLVRSANTNKILITAQLYSVTSQGVTFFFSDDQKEKLSIGGFYKIQLAFIDSYDNIGYYSNTGIAKYIEHPVLSIQDESTKNNSFTGVYRCKDVTEKLYSYCFTLTDRNGKIIETSGMLLHNSTKDVGVEQNDTWVPSIVLDNGSNYNLQFSIETINGYKASITKTITAKKDEEGFLPNGIKLTAAFNRENAYIELRISSIYQNDARYLINGKFQIFKTSSKDNFQSKYLVAYFALDNQDLFEQTFKDFTIEAGYDYQYILQAVNDYGIYSEELYAENLVTDVFFEHMYLFDGQKQLKIKFNPKVSTFKDTILEQKVETIGSKYPFIFKNGTVKYKELNLSGLISYHMDEENLFVKDSDIWTVLDPTVEEGLQTIKEAWTHNLTDSSITAERAFKTKVLDWLNNGEVKLFKSPVEGNFLLRLMNVSLSPNDTVGRMLHTFTATGYEIEDIEKHNFSQALKMDKSQKYIGYRTIPLYDFPNKKIAQKIISNTDSQKEWIVVHNNSLYEIIADYSLEYVVAARFEDIKPGTKFTVDLERGLERTVFSFEIGATGCYAIPRDLGYHILSIKLVESDWLTDDYGKDIINNRGQVTYEYELKAAHNNFNDITRIDADIAIGQPWYPTIYNVEIKEPLVDGEGKRIYHYKEVGSIEETFVECAYFEKEDNGKKTSVLCFYGKDYYKEIDDDGKIQYYSYNPEENDPLTLSSNLGRKYAQGEYKYDIIPAKTLQAISEENYTHDNFIWTQQFEIIGKNSPIMYQIYKSSPDPDNYCFDGQQFYQKKTENDDTQKNLFDLNGIYALQNLTEQTMFYLFTPQTDSQGNKIKSTVEQVEYIQNPFYVRMHQVQAIESDNQNSGEKEIVGYKDNGNIKAKSYKLIPLYNTEVGEEDNYSKDLIYKNFIPNTYYDFTNVNDEYYIKDQVLNLYNIDFELIQVFYQEDLKNTQNFTFEGFTEYRDIYEEKGYSRTERIITQVKDSDFAGVGKDGSPLYFSNNNIFIDGSEVVADTIQLIPTDRDNDNNENVLEQLPLITQYSSISIAQLGALKDSLFEEICELYALDFESSNIDDKKKEASSLDYWYNKDHIQDLYIMEPSSKVQGGYRLKRINVEKDGENNFYYTKNGEEEKTTVTAEQVCLQIYLEAGKQYSRITTPKDNEFIIVYNNRLDDPVTIDLTNRYSYNLSLDQFEDGITGIAGIYLGKNVRAFATYKRKAYDYRALVSDGSFYVDLTHEKGEVVNV